MSPTTEVTAEPPRVLLTFDNLGEAADVERGLWPGGDPVGRHPSVTEALPRILDRLAALGLSATFFVEAWSCSVYPGAVADIAAAGHEVGWHGWRHEVWADLEPERQAALLERGRAAFDAAGLIVRGFRPPGGELPAGAWELLAQAGVTWCSPAWGSGPEPSGGITSFPFRWEDVDAYHLMPSFADRRIRRGAAAAPATARQTAERLLAAIDDPPPHGAPVVLVLHPFLLLQEDWARAADTMLRRLAELTRTGARRVATGAALIAG